MARPLWVELGYVARAQGLRGGVRVRLYNEASTLLKEVSRIRLEGPDGRPAREVAIHAVSSSGGGCVLTLEGVSDRTASEALVGAKVLVSPADLPPLEPDEFYHFDLIGMDVLNSSGEALGKLEEVFSTPANDIYVVRGAIGELMVPAVAPYVVSIDLDAGRMIVSQVEDLIEE